MKILIISRSILSRIIGRGSRRTRVNIPCCGTHFSRVHIPIIILHSKFSIKKLGTLTRAKRILKSIQPKSNDQFYTKCGPINGWVSQKGCNKQSKSSQHKSMAPQKSHGFDGVIKNLLPFMHCLNLHVLLIGIFYSLSISIQFLKIHVFRQDKKEFSLYSGNVMTACIRKFYL